MNDFRKELLDRMIRIYGFEHEIVIQFAKACEAYTTPETSAYWDKILKFLVEGHEVNPYFPDEEEEE